MIYIFIFIFVLTYLLYKYFTRNFDYWEKRNVPYLKPLPFFGNYYEIFTFRTTIGKYMIKLCNHFNSPYFGVFVLNKPHLVIKCTELIKTVLVKDFSNFSDRSILCDEKCDSISGNMLFFLRNPKWKAMRSKTASAFSNMKLKGMFNLVYEVSLELNKYIENNMSKDSIEAKELCAKYTTDVIASTAFGINGCSFLDEEADFRKTGRAMFKLDLASAARQFCYIMMPTIVKIFRFSFFRKSVNDFFRKAFWDIVDYRNKTNTKRNDLVDILMQIVQESDDAMEFTGDRVVAQAVMYFGGGFETTSTTMTFTLYEICISFDIQNKVREEVKTVFKKYGQINFDAIQDLKYLNMVVCETLRKYAVVPYLDRICLNDYKLPKSNLTVEKGTPIIVPVLGLHYNAQIFPEPEVFNPERFSNDSKALEYVYLPFGGGPRICPGERLGMLVIKLGIANILLEYEVYKTSSTPVPIIYEKKTFITLPGTLPIGFRRIKADS